MRRSRITYAPFAAGLLLGLIATLWFLFGLTPDSPRVQPYVPETGMPAVGEPRDFGEGAPPPVTVTPRTEQPLFWQTSSVETPGLPDERVRQRKVEAILPDELYPSQRVILRHVRIDARSDGMQVSGEVLTDFFADRAPQWLPSGPLLGLRVMVELYEHDVVLARGRDDVPLPPHIDPRKPGRLVPGQSTEAVISTPRGQFATAPFVLPVLSRPLAPGEYSLVASLRFRVQAEELQLAVKWCSDLYGARVDQDPDTLELTYRDVLSHPELHEEVYTDLLEERRVVSDWVDIHVGALVREHTVRLVGPEAAPEPANIIIEDLHCTLCAQVSEYTHQLDNVEAVVDQELETKLKIELKRNANQQEQEKLARLKEKWKQQVVEDKKRIKRDNAALIMRLGGRLNAEETAMLKRIDAARPEVLQQVADFQDRLALNIWILCDGVLRYTGWAAMYLPGYNACEAIQNERLAALQPVLDPTAQALKWQEMVYRWRFVPDSLRDAAFAYLRRKEETNDWHPREFTAHSGQGYKLDTARWAKWREQWLADLDAALNGWRTVDTTRIYANQAWPLAVALMREMHHQAAALPWSWEYYIRTEVQKEPAAEVTLTWPADIAKRAGNPPGTIKRSFDASRKRVKEAANIADFMSRYSKAVAAGAKPPGED